MKSSIPVLILTSVLAVSIHAGPYDDWGKYRSVTVNTTDTDGGADVAAEQTGFPLLVRLSDENAAAGSDVLAEALAGGADLRFTIGDGQAALAYEIEHWSDSAAAVWVLVPEIAGDGNTSIRLYWDKDGAASESNGAAVFSTSNGYEAVFHMNEAEGDTIHDVTSNGYMGIPTGTTDPVDAAGPVGVAKAFGGEVGEFDVGGAYRLETSDGGNTYDSFDYTGLDALFSVSVWTNFDAYPGGFNERHGILTKGDHGENTLDGNDPMTQWFLRPNIPERTLHFQRVAEIGYATTPYSIVDGSGPVDGVLNNWNYVTYSADGAGSENLFRLYNDEGSTFRSIGDEGGVHQDVDVFIGGFASNSGTGGEKSNGTHFLNGMIDEVRISNVSRSADWSDLEYATQAPGQTAVTLGEAVEIEQRPVFYREKNGVYMLDEEIEDNEPVLDASLGAPTGYSIDPEEMPDGLSFSTSTGIISGTPEEVTAAQEYIVTATFSGTTGSDTLTIAVTAGDPPGSPTGVSATASGGQATVIWNAPLVSGSTEITGYVVRAVEDTGKTCTWSEGPLTCTVTDLENGTAYTFTVVAENSVGSSEPSSPTEAVTPATVPGVPTDVSATLQSGAGASATVAVSFTAPEDDGGAPITGSFVFGSPSGACFAAGTSTSCNVTNLEYDTEYTFRAASSNSLGLGDTSEPSESFVPTSILPGSFTIRNTNRPFTFTLSRAALASTEAFTLTIRDVWGRSVWSSTVHPASDGLREISWDGRNSSGRKAAAGVYLVRVTTANGRSVANFIEKAVLQH